MLRNVFNNINYLYKLLSFCMWIGGDLSIISWYLECIVLSVALRVGNHPCFFFFNQWWGRFNNILKGEFHHVLWCVRVCDDIMPLKVVFFYVRSLYLRVLYNIMHTHNFIRVGKYTAKYRFLLLFPIIGMLCRAENMNSDNFCTCSKVYPLYDTIFQ